MFAKIFCYAVCGTILGSGISFFLYIGALFIQGAIYGHLGREYESIIPLSFSPFIIIGAILGGLIAVAYLIIKRTDAS